MVGYFLPSSGSAPGPLVRTTGTLLPGCASRVFNTLYRHLFVLLQCILGGSWPDLPGLHVAVTQTACCGPFYLGCHAFHFQELGGFPSLLPSLLSASFLPSFLQKQQLVLIYGKVVPPPPFPFHWLRALLPFRAHFLTCLGPWVVTPTSKQESGGCSVHSQHASAQANIFFCTEGRRPGPWRRGAFQTDVGRPPCLEVSWSPACPPCPVAQAGSLGCTVSMQSQLDALGWAFTT